MRPEKPSASSGVLTIKRGSNPATTVPIRFDIKPYKRNWITTYEAAGVQKGISRLTVTHQDGGTNAYVVVENGAEKRLAGSETMVSFAGSDFWVADLGLEFLAWPGQRILRKEIRRGQSCSVLESTNPNPEPGTYVRVLSWVDIDTGGIVNADAFGNERRPIKEFAAKSFKKIEGRWELKEIEMYDRRSNSRTTLTFDLRAGKTPPETGSR